MGYYYVRSKKNSVRDDLPFRRQTDFAAEIDNQRSEW